MSRDLGNRWDINDFLNAKSSWTAQQGKSHVRIRFYKFTGYNTENSSNPNESFRKPVFQVRDSHVWLSQVKVYDTIKRGYFTTGDLDIVSEYVIQGYSASYTLPTGVVVPEYSGDLVQWNGKLWEVADQLEPTQWGYQAEQVYYRSVLRRTQRSGSGAVTGAGK